ncbi:MAG: hypothetical protein AAGA55_02500 [Planctomycetota bacterium]
MNEPVSDRARRDRRRAGCLARLSAALLGFMACSGHAEPAQTFPLDLSGRGARAVTIELEAFESVGSFLRARDGAFINSGAFVDIGIDAAVVGVSWDVTIERVDLITTYADVGIGLLDLNATPFVSFPDDAPHFGLGGTDGWDSAQGSPWIERVHGWQNLSEGIPGHEGDLSVRSDGRGFVYFEVFEIWDDDDDRGITAGDTHLGVDALVNGNVVFWVVPAPWALPVMLAGWVGVCHRPVRSGPFRRR